MFLIGHMIILNSTISFKEKQQNDMCIKVL